MKIQPQKPPVAKIVVAGHRCWENRIGSAFEVLVKDTGSLSASLLEHNLCNISHFTQNDALSKTSEVNMVHERFEAFLESCFVGVLFSLNFQFSEWIRYLQIESNWE